MRAKLFFVGLIFIFYVFACVQHTIDHEYIHQQAFKIDNCESTVTYRFFGVFGGTTTAKNCVQSVEGKQMHIQNDIVGYNAILISTFMTILTVFLVLKDEK
jgi:disulfide bond formation protein DsbB